MNALAIDSKPDWKRTGYRYFPYAAEQFGHWWVLRFNPAFPEHDMYTIFVDGRAVADVTGDLGSEFPLVATIGALPTTLDNAGQLPPLDPLIAEAVIGAVSKYGDYGSEHDDPCLTCSTRGTEPGHIVAANGGDDHERT